MTSDAEAAASILALLAALGGGVITGGLVWLYAPPIGGAFWPYIHAGVTAIAFFVGLKIGLLAGAVGMWLVAGAVIVLDWVIS